MQRGFLCTSSTEFFSSVRTVFFNIWGIFTSSIFGTDLNIELTACKYTNAKREGQPPPLQNYEYITLRAATCANPLTYELHVKIDMNMIRPHAWGVGHLLNLFNPQSCVR